MTLFAASGAALSEASGAFRGRISWAVCWADNLGRSEKPGAQIQAIARQNEGYEQPGATENGRDPERFDINWGPRCPGESLSESSHFVFSSFSASDVRRRGISTIQPWLAVVAV
jgi:hypothetical protein